MPEQQSSIDTTSPVKELAGTVATAVVSGVASAAVAAAVGKVAAPSPSSVPPAADDTPAAG